MDKTGTIWTKVDVSLTKYIFFVKELTLNQSLLGGIKIMAVKVAINGFGRIGRLAFRQMFGQRDLKS